MKLAVVGNPIAHSKSPLIFRFLFQHLKLTATYDKQLLQTAAEITDLFREGYTGLNVTAPFKQEVMPLLDKLSDAAKAIGSVNTIVKENNVLVGCNTDYLGVVNALKSNGIALAGKKCMVLGAGGAARAAIYGLKQAGAFLKVYNRTEAKANRLSKEFEINTVSVNMLKEELAQTDILIDTLPSGQTLLENIDLPQQLIILDASYPQSVYRGRIKNENLIGGEQWLLHQALPAFKHFTGKEIELTKSDQQTLLHLLTDAN